MSVYVYFEQILILWILVKKKSKKKLKKKLLNFIHQFLLYYNNNIIIPNIALTCMYPNVKRENFNFSLAKLQY